MGMMDSPICQAFAECRSLELKPSLAVSSDQGVVPEPLHRGNLPASPAGAQVGKLTGTLPNIQAAYISNSFSKGFQKQPFRSS